MSANVAGLDWSVLLDAGRAAGVPADWFVMCLPAIEAGMLAAIYPADDGAPEPGKDPT